MDISDVVQNLPVINEAASDMLDMFGPEFTNTPGGHIETDIAAAASLAGIISCRSFALHRQLSLRCNSNNPGFSAPDFQNRNAKII